MISAADRPAPGVPDRIIRVILSRIERVVFGKGLIASLWGRHGSRLGEGEVVDRGGHDVLVDEGHVAFVSDGECGTQQMRGDAHDASTGTPQELERRIGHDPGGGAGGLHGVVDHGKEVLTLGAGKEVIW